MGGPWIAFSMDTPLCTSYIVGAWEYPLAPGQQDLDPTGLFFFPHPTPGLALTDATGATLPGKLGTLFT